MNRFDSKLCIKIIQLHMRNKKKNTLKGSKLTEIFMLHELVQRCVWGGGGGVGWDSRSVLVLQSNPTIWFAYPFPV